jgi:CDP-diacylglycerol--glycerol-3-phosphate 3-phosphatidyltransferase
MSDRGSTVFRRDSQAMRIMLFRRRVMSMKALVSNLPNRLSLFRILLSPVFYFLIVSENPVLRQLSMLVYCIAALTDWYDGEIARSRRLVTKTGKFLDPLADKFLTSAAFLAFASLRYMPWWMFWIVIIRDILITILRSLAENRGFHIVTTKSAKVKTFMQMTALYYLLLVIVCQDVGWIRGSVGSLFPILLHARFIFLMMLCVTMFTLLTGVQYLYDNRTMIPLLCSARTEKTG